MGCPELGSLLLMPTTGELSVDYKEYGSRYKDEQASPGYYSNFLTRYNVKTEVTATPRTGVARFTFPAGQSHVLLNLGEGLTNESGAFLRQTGKCEFEGMKLLGTFCLQPTSRFSHLLCDACQQAARRFGLLEEAAPHDRCRGRMGPR